MALEHQITPGHIAIILDGNRRYAKKIGLKPWIGHAYGVNKVRQLLEWCREIGILELTLYCFSTENFSRNKKEIGMLFKLFKREFKSMNNRKDIMENKIRVNVIGRIGMLPDDLRNNIKEITKNTKSHRGFIVNFALAYGGRQEITDSLQKIAKKIKAGKLSPKEISEDIIKNNLYLKSEPDMLIRPGGEKRISNFLIWQSAYSELFFIDKLWPEFTKEDLINCVEEFRKRERRMGL